MGRDELIQLIASVQRGRVGRWQLLAAGLGEGVIDRCLSRGRLVREHRGVYALPLSGEIPLGPDAAGVLAGGPGSSLSHHSASVLWRVRSGIADPVHITLPYRRRGPASNSRLIVHRSRILMPADVRIHRGLPVTSPARTLLDTAAHLPDREVEQMLDEALFVQRVLTGPELTATLQRSGAHPGRARLARVSGHADPERGRTESPPAERLLQLILTAGLPEPRTEVWILAFKLDMFWPEHHLAVEVDAYGTHGSPRRFASDRRRDARLLTECGITTLRFTDRQIHHRPLEVIATLARGFSRDKRSV